MLETTGSRAVDTAIAVAVDACRDGDPSPEECVVITYEIFRAAGLVKDEAD